MPRLLILISVVTLYVFGGMSQPSVAHADAAWPNYPLDPTGQGDDHTIDRGYPGPPAGHYLGLGKIIACWLLFVLWVWSTDWVSRDCQKTRQNYVVWNSLVVFVFLAGFVLVWLIPLFPIGLVLLLLAYAVPVLTYIQQRNASVQAHEKVMTGGHLRAVLSQKAARIGVKIEAEKRAEHEKGPQVEFEAQGGANERDDAANLLRARQSPGYMILKHLISDAVGKRGDALILDRTSGGVAVRYQIDGVWHSADPVDHDSGEIMLAVLKTLAGFNINERRKRQAGTFGASLDKKKLACQLTSQGTDSGERCTVRIDDGARKFDTMPDLGMREKLREPLQEVLDGNSGCLLFSAMPGGGLTTTIDVAVDTTDRLMRNFVAIEDEDKREREIENVDVTTYRSSAGETPAAVLPKLIRTYPDVIVCRDIPDAITVEILCEQVGENRLVIAGIRAKEACEALLRILALKVDAQEFAAAITGVLNQRLVRTLCASCKVAYEPSPDMLKKLGIPQGRIQVLYREPKPDELDGICLDCGGIGYRGRTAIFEWLQVNDQVRKVLVSQAALEPLRAAGRQAGMRTPREEGVLLVAKGVTSLTELRRVLNGGA